MDKRIGQMLLNGGSIKELRKVFPNFPKKTTKESFMELGYKESTSKKYLYLLKKNSEANSTKKESTPLKENDLVDVSSLLTNFIVTENADYKNLLVDTCAFQYDDSCQLIDIAEHVTFIDSIWSEMDRKKNDDHNNPKLAANIREYTRKAVHNRKKYMLSTFSGMHNEKYPDNILLQYMMILPRQIRPTLITADYNLSNAAFNLGLESILYLPENSCKKTDIEENNQKISKYGVTISPTKNGKRIVQYKGLFPLYVLRDGKEIKINNLTSVIPGEILILKETCKGKVVERRIEV